MKLLIFSDIHGDLEALEKLLATEADYYIAAGDLSTWGRGLERCGELLKSRAGRVYALPGNHESAAQNSAMCRQYGLDDLHERTVQLGRWTVAGLGYSNPTPFNTPGEYTEAEIAQRLQPFAGIQPLLLICHCPPFGASLDRIRDGIHGGSTAVRDFLAAHEPAHFVCGHIHEAAGTVERLGKTLAANAGKRGYLLELK